MVVVDSHMHLIRKENFDRETYEELGLRLPEDTPLEKLVKWLGEARVQRAVIMGQDMSRIWKTTFGEEYVWEAYQKFPDLFIPFASVEPVDEYGRFKVEALDYLERCVKERGYKGVLLTPPYGHYFSNDRAVYPFYEVAQRYGIVVQFHHSAQMGPSILAPTKYASLFNLNDITVDFPRLKIVVEHLGYPWSEHLFVLMANDENLWTDLAQTYNRPMWLAWNLVLAKEYGVIDRVMYASDYVSCNYDLFSDNPAEDFKKWIRFIQEGLNRICMGCGWPSFTEEEIRGILGENAMRLFNIKA